MDFYGFRGKSNLWFKNYLSNRKQYVHINGEKSNERNLTCGVPQGSVLGPILFLIFINDLPSATNFFTLLFADDTTFQISGKDPKILFEIANKELSKAATWFRVNKLTLNISKTKFIVFRKPNMKIDIGGLSLKIQNKPIDRIGHDCPEKSFKFVGHHLDEFLDWSHHITHVKK